MALISPGNLVSLHVADGRLSKQLLSAPSSRYRIQRHGLEFTIPNPTLFNARSKGDPGPRALPTIRECAIHLEMLEVFHTLRHEVIQSKDLDEAFDIAPMRRTVYRKRWNQGKYIAEASFLKDDYYLGKRKKKWPSFLSIATSRFHDWIQMVENHLKEANSGAPSPKFLFLPPLDILVIWHAFLLNCDDFKEYCTTRNLHHIQGISFPWADIHAAIDSRTWKYTLSSEHSDWLLSKGIDANLVNALAAAGRASGPVKDAVAAFGQGNFSYTSGDESNTLVRTVMAAHANRMRNQPIVENVERQCVFVDKMHAHRWIRSPAVQGTLRRAVDRYDKFLHLFRLYPHRFLVPTLDVDLVWHTHQCSAANYREFVTERVGRFINHEDKIGRSTLDDGFTNAEQWYRLTYGEQYQVCLCWSCEAILSAVEKLDDNVLDDIEPDITELTKDIEHEVHYYREVEVSRRLVRGAPIWSH